MGGSLVQSSGGLGITRAAAKPNLALLTHGVDRLELQLVPQRQRQTKQMPIIIGLVGVLRKIGRNLYELHGARLGRALIAEAKLHHEKPYFHRNVLLRNRLHT